MAYEISQFDLASRQLLTSGTRPAPKTCTEIGNAKVTQSIFGKARVRIICAHDRIRRVRMLSTILAVTIAGAIWQLTEHGDKLFGNASESVIATVQVSPPAFMPEYIGPAESPLKKQSPRTPTEAEIYQLTTRPLPPPQPSTPQQPNMSLANPIAANPAVVQPQSAGAPQATPKAVSPAAPLAQQAAPRTTSPASPQTANQTAPQVAPRTSTATAPGATPPAAPLAANSAAARPPAVPQQPPKPVAVTQTATPIVATPAAAQPAASKPATPAAAPSTKANAPANPPVSQQPSAPASTQP